MSIAEAERFADDLNQNKELLAQVTPEASGLASIVALGKRHGYDFTLDEARQYIRSRSPRELSDVQLDAIAGGKKHGGSSAVTQVKVAQTIAVVTTTVEATQTVTTAVQTGVAAEHAAVAADIVAVAFVVIE